MYSNAPGGSDRMLRGIFFDLDDTLIGYAEAERQALLAGCAVAARRRPDDVDIDRLTAEIYAAYENGYASGTPGYAELATLPVQEIRRRLVREAFLAIGIDDAALAEETIAAYDIAERKALVAFPDATAVLERLRPYFRLGLITNGPSSMQRRKLAALALEGCFDIIVVDTEFGCPKPDIRIFEHAAAQAALTPAELLFVGNSWHHDVTGAREAGWHTVWMNPAREPLPAGEPPDAVIAGLTELLTLPIVAEAITGLKEP